MKILLFIILSAASTLSVELLFPVIGIIHLTLYFLFTFITTYTINIVFKLSINDLPSYIYFILSLEKIFKTNCFNSVYCFSFFKYIKLSIKLRIENTLDFIIDVKLLTLSMYSCSEQL